MRKPKHRWHLQALRSFSSMLMAVLLPALSVGVFAQGVLAQETAGPSFAGTDGNVPGLSSNSGGYNHNAPSTWGRGGSVAANSASYVNQPGAVGFAAGHSGYVNGGNNGNQSAVKLPASNCCGKLTRNSNYYPNEYSGYMESFMRNATSGGAAGSNAVPGMSTAGGGAAYGRSAGRGMSGMPGQMYVPGQMGMPGHIPGQSSVPGQMSVPGQVPGSI